MESAVTLDTNTLRECGREGGRETEGRRREGERRAGGREGVRERWREGRRGRMESEKRCINMQVFDQKARKT